MFGGDEVFRARRSTQRLEEGVVAITIIGVFYTTDKGRVVGFAKGRVRGGPVIKISLIENRVIITSHSLHSIVSALTLRESSNCFVLGCRQTNSNILYYVHVELIIY